MCEYCKKTEVTIETLDTDDQYPCEWITEEAGPGACAELALYSVSEWYVEDHLCDAHKLATEKEMEEGLGDFLDSVEFRSQFEMKPIAEKRLATTWIRQRRTGRSVGGKRLTQNIYSTPLCFVRSMPPRPAAVPRRYDRPSLS
jgi:hypothetical protein